MTVLARTLGTLAALSLAAPTALLAQGRQVDVLIRGGQVIDGTGSAARRADVAILGDRIVFVGDAGRTRFNAKRTVDATGLIVAPGFIDTHAHSLEDLRDSARKSNVNYLMQGVTTVITGNDGHGPSNVAEILAEWDKNGIGTNAGLLVGHGNVRRQVLGMSNAPPKPEQVASMRSIVATAMRGGALGLSTGLFYSPGSFSQTDEVVELAKEAARAGGIYDSHMRDESSYSIGLIGSINETIRIAREARIPANISHIKALGVDVWGQSDSVIKLIRKARAEGLQITADQYPYLASGTGMSASLLPTWAQAGGRDSVAARFNNPALRDKLIADMQDNMRRRGGPKSFLISGSRDRSLVGKTLDVIAQERGTTPIDAAIAIIRSTDASVASFNMNEDDLRKFMVQDFVMTGSDGSGGHPRKYGTYPRLLREYVLNQKLLTLPQAVHRSSQLPAQTFKLANRGQLRDGYFADVIVFDTATVNEKATYVEPSILAEGMRYVFVNGTAAVEDGKYTGALSGKPLRGRGASAGKDEAGAR